MTAERSFGTEEINRITQISILDGRPSFQNLSGDNKKNLKNQVQRK